MPSFQISKNYTHILKNISERFLAMYIVPNIDSLSAFTIWFCPPRSWLLWDVFRSPLPSLHSGSRLVQVAGGTRRDYFWSRYEESKIGKFDFASILLLNLLKKVTFLFHNPSLRATCYCHLPCLLGMALCCCLYRAWGNNSPLLSVAISRALYSSLLNFFNPAEVSLFYSFQLLFLSVHSVFCRGHDECSNTELSFYHQLGS